MAKWLDYTAQLRDIDAPVCSDELDAGIHHAQLAFFERNGHYPFIEEPEAFRGRGRRLPDGSRHSPR